MGAQFQVDVNVTTHGSDEVNKLEKTLTDLQSKGVNIKVNVEGLDKLDTSKLDKQALSAGKQVSQNLSKGIKANKISIPDPIDYGKAQNQAKKEAKKIAETMKAAIPDASDKDTEKWAKGFQNTVKKTNNAIAKENEKAIKQAQKQSQQRPSESRPHIGAGGSL